jgi:hypothetical protein
VSHRRFIQIFVLVALVLAPFGRNSVARAMTMHDAPMAMHCAGQPMPDQGKDHRMAVDCMIACAAMTPAPAGYVLPQPAPDALPLAAPAPILSSIRPEADPPPPRNA